MRIPDCIKKNQDRSTFFAGCYPSFGPDPVFLGPGIFFVPLFPRDGSARKGTEECQKRQCPYSGFLFPLCVCSRGWEDRRRLSERQGERKPLPLQERIQP